MITPTKIRNSPEFICKECSWMRIDETERPLRRTEQEKGKCFKCYCTKDGALEIHKALSQSKDVDLCFLGYTEYEMLNREKSPRWCPLKTPYHAIPVSKKKAYEIISTGAPKGMFMVLEPYRNIVCAIFNIDDCVEAEEFSDRSDAAKWLKEKVCESNA